MSNDNRKVYGYCRISTPKQSIDRQIRNITAAFPEAYLFQEAYTGKKIAGRKEFEKLAKIVREGDTIVFDSVSRMSRHAEEGIAQYLEWEKKGINLVFLKERHIDTETYHKARNNALPMTGTNVDFILEGINRYLEELAKEQIRLAFEQAQKECDDLRQRTKEGLVTAKAKGNNPGLVKGTTLTTKKSIAAKEIIKKHSKDFFGTLDDTDCIKLAGISRNSYYKYKRELAEEINA